MVLVNTLTVEAINTALIALQRGQSIVVGGEKGTTVNNITISNSGGGSSGGLDFSPQINALDKRVGLLEKAEEVLRLENERQEERITALEGLGINDFFFDETSRDLTIELQNGETFETTITSESFSMYIDNGELVIKIGDQERRVPISQGVQADWTETDSTDPSFIKNKIPIWITDGSADDNMSPIDSITDGEMRPPTSNAVFDEIASLDVASVGGSGKYIESISEVDGKIVPVEQNIADTVTVDNMQSVSSNAVASLLNTNLDDTDVVDISSQLTKYLGLTKVLAIRRNNVVQLYLYGDYTGSSSYGTQTLATGLPQKYRPISQELASSFAVVSYETSIPFVIPSRLAIGTDGVIRLNETTMPSGAKIVFTITYVGA